MRFRVSGLDAVTNATYELVIEAIDKMAAQLMAESKGIVVAAIVELPEPARPQLAKLPYWDPPADDIVELSGFCTFFVVIGWMQIIGGLCAALGFCVPAIDEFASWPGVLGFIIGGITFVAFGRALACLAATDQRLRKMEKMLRELAARKPGS